MEWAVEECPQSGLVARVGGMTYKIHNERKKGEENRFRAKEFKMNAG